MVLKPMFDNSSVESLISYNCHILSIFTKYVIAKNKSAITMFNKNPNDSELRRFLYFARLSYAVSFTVSKMVSTTYRTRRNVQVLRANIDKLF